MPDLAARLLDDLKAAVRSGDATRRDVLRYLRADIHNVEIERGHPLADDEVETVIRRQIKQRRDSIEQFARGGRQDLVDSEERQITVLQTYLPASMSRQELLETARAVAAEVGASGPRDMGRLMPVLQARVGVRAEGRAIAEVAREVLASGSAAGAS
ncbi:MAG TPA: GatB/YqeY domain-containing protein [Thermomicrobiaceae bacterium]|nr:GatB/YqeY domain-containing protein [Thermomicrobiaceae bacterium]